MYSDNYCKKNYNVGIYCRLSHDDGEMKESNSIGNQKSLLTKYVIDQGWNIVDIYIDDGYSGLSFDRPGFKKLLDDIADKKISLVITKDMSRLGRDYIQVGYYTEKFFPENKVRYIAVNDNLDTGRIDNNDMTPFKAVINDMYSKDISKKVRSVFNLKRQEGKFIGPFAPYGYEKNPENKNQLIIDKEAATVVRRIFQLYLEGKGLTAIAKILNEEGIVCPSYYKRKKYHSYNVGKAKVSKWCGTSVKSILNNPVYTGCVAQNKYEKINYKSSKFQAIDKQNWIIVKDMHESIISEEDFEKVQALKNQKVANFTTAKRTTKLFSGLAFCADCGEYMTYYKTPSGYEYLICSAYKRYGKSHCSRHAISEKDLQNLIITDFKEMANEFTNRKEIEKEALKLLSGKRSSLQIYKDELYITERRLEEIKVMIKSTYEDKVKGIIDEEGFVAFYNDFNKEKEILTKRYDELSKRLVVKQDEKNIDKKVQKLIDAAFNPKKLNRLLLIEMIEKIKICEDGNIKIYYNIKKPY